MRPLERFRKVVRCVSIVSPVFAFMGVFAMMGGAPTRAAYGVFAVGTVVYALAVVVLLWMWACDHAD
jgi:hypothetical protein